MMIRTDALAKRPPPKHWIDRMLDAWQLRTQRRAQEYVLRMISRSCGFITGMGPCDGPVSDDRPDHKYPVAAMDAGRWFVVDVDGATFAAYKILLEAPDAQSRMAKSIEMSAALPGGKLPIWFWLGAYILTDTGAQLIFPAEFAAKVDFPGDPRHAFWSGKRGFFPMRLVDKKDPRKPRIMIPITAYDHGKNKNLAAAWNAAAQTYAAMSQTDRDLVPFLDDAWRVD